MFFVAYTRNYTIQRLRSTFLITNNETGDSVELSGKDRDAFAAKFLRTVDFKGNILRDIPAVDRLCIYWFNKKKPIK